MMKGLRRIRHAVIGIAFVLSSSVVLAAPPLEKTSLRLAPADASMYSASFGLHDWWARFEKTNAYKRVRNLPITSLAIGGWEALKLDPSNPIGMYEQWRTSDEENEILVEALMELGGQEFFVILDKNFNSSFFNQFSSISNELSMLNALGEAEAMEGVIKRIEEIEFDKIPQFVIGFDTKHQKTIVKQLGRLEPLWALVPEEVKSFLTMSRKQSENLDLVLLGMDGSKVDWDQLLADSPYEEEHQERLTKKLKEIKFFFGIGLWQDYAVIVFGPGPDSLEKLLDGPRLQAIPEMQVLSRHQPEGIVSLSYVSKAFTSSSIEGAFTNPLEQVRSAMELTGSEIPGELFDKLQADLRALEGSIVSEVSAQVGVTHLEEKGWGTYSYSWSDHPVTNTDPPLLYKHLGGDSLIQAAWVVQIDQPVYPLLEAWGAKVPEYMELFANSVGESDPDLLKSIAILKDYGGKLGVILKDDFFPAFGSPEFGFVIDAKSQLTSFAEEPLQKPIPIPELSIVVRITDRAKLESAGKKMVDLWNEMMKAIAEDGTEEVLIPYPVASEMGTHSVYSFSIVDALMKEIGIEAFSPHWAVNNDLLIISTSKPLTSRIVTSTKSPFLDTIPPNLIPLSVGYVNIDGIAGKIEGVMMMAVEAALEEEVDLEGLGLPIAGNLLKNHITTIFGFIRCCKSITDYSYQEGNLVINYSRFIWEDMK